MTYQQNTEHKDTAPSCKICCLYSGSKGNCTYISAGGASILIDAGKSYRSLRTALREIDVDIAGIDAIFVTHEHRDHISALRTVSHKHAIPIYILLPSAEVYYGLKDEKLCASLMLQTDSSFEIKVKELSVKAFPTSHDSRASVGYRLSFVEDGEHYSIGYATDTGYVTSEMRKELLGCFAAVIESNHDSDMLREGAYPYELKKRISSRKGHLSNAECAEFACELCARGARHLMLAHLSEENNIPSLALSQTRSAIADESITLCVASQEEAVWLYGGD